MQLVRVFNTSVSAFCVFVFMLIAQMMFVMSGNWFVVWFFMEFLTVLSFFYVFFPLNQFNFNNCAKAFVFKVAIGIVFFVACVWGALHGNAVSVSNSIGWGCFMLIQICFFCEIGMAPAHFWFIQLVSGLGSWFTRWVHLFFVKIALFIICVETFSGYVGFFFFVFFFCSVFFGAAGVFTSVDMIFFISFSSVFFYCWSFFIGVGSLFSIATSMFIFYLMIFSAICYFFVSSYPKFMKIFDFSDLSWDDKYKIFFMLWFISGVPPFGFFIFKLFSIYSMASAGYFFYVCFIWLFFFYGAYMYSYMRLMILSLLPLTGVFFNTRMSSNFFYWGFSMFFTIVFFFSLVIFFYYTSFCIFFLLWEF